MTRWPSAISVAASSTVAIAQPSTTMTVMLGPSRAASRTASMIFW